MPQESPGVPEVEGAFGIVGGAIACCDSEQGGVWHQSHIFWSKSSPRLVSAPSGLHEASPGARVLRNAGGAIPIVVAADDLGALIAVDAVDRPHGRVSRAG